MKTISLKLPDGLHVKLDRAARQQGKSKSDLVRDALEQLLNGHRQPQMITVGDLAGDLLGTAEGPTDLATNPKHMEGYGR